MKTSRRGKTAAGSLYFPKRVLHKCLFLGGSWQLIGSCPLVWYGWKASSQCCGGHSCIGLKNLGDGRGLFLGGSVVKNSPVMQETQETWVQSLGWEDPLEEGMATNSSILAWRIPWKEEPGELQSMGSQRVVTNS